MDDPVPHRSLLALSIEGAAAFAFAELLLGVSLGHSVPALTAPLIYFGELVLGVAILLVVLALLNRAVRAVPDREALVVFFVPLASGAQWLSELYRREWLVVALGAWIAWLGTAAVVVLWLVQPAQRFPSSGMPQLRLRLLASAVASLGVLAAIHHVVGTAVEVDHPVLFPAVYFLAATLIASLALMPRGRGGEVLRRPLAASLTAAATYGAAIALGASLVGSAPEPQFSQVEREAVANTARPPNLVLISLDTLRADHLGCYGYMRNTSAALDAFAQRGMLIETCVATAPWTLPSHSALFTSRFPGELPAYEVGDFPSLVPHLRQHGYQTAGFTAGRLMSREQFGQGFDVFHDTDEDAYVLGLSPALLKATLLLRQALGQSGVGVPLLNVLNSWRPGHNGATSAWAGPEPVFAAANQWLEQHGRDGPFFLFVHTFGVHEYYLNTAEVRHEARRWQAQYDGSLLGYNFRYRSRVPTGREDLEFFVALYDGAIKITDAALGRLLDTLDHLDLAQNTLVVITSDHGEGLRPDLGRTWHRDRLHDDLIHVPLILSMPGQLPAGQRVSGQISQLDVVPTVLELLGRPQLEGARGRSLASLLRGNANRSADRDFAFAETADYVPEKDAWAVRSPQFKYIRHARGDQMLHALQLDPAELRDVSASEPETLEVMQRHLDAFQSLLTIDQEPPDAEILSTLRALGYVGGDEPTSEE